MSELIERVENELCEVFREFLGYRRQQIEQACESPIEVALALAILTLDKIGGEPSGPIYFCADHVDEHELPGTGPVLIPQYEWEGKRIDFKYIDKPVVIFIECDGHDFHERTKYQATRDRRKDRLIQSVGIPILRFTGFEIYHDAIACAREVYLFVSDRHEQMYLAREKA